MGISNYPKNAYTPKKGIEINIHDKVNDLASNTTFTTRAGKVLFPAKWDIDYKELK